MSFNPLDHPSMLMFPKYLRHPFPWLKHIPLAYLTVDLARPRVLVELGVCYGTSYCAFCQAVRELNTGTRCARIDTWTGDSMTGAYLPTVYTELKKNTMIRNMADSPNSISANSTRPWIALPTDRSICFTSTATTPTRR